MTQALIETYAASSPISRWLNFSVVTDGDENLFQMDFGEHHIGNAIIRALHGGGIAAFLEFSAEATLFAHLDGNNTLTALSTDIDYLRSARAENLFSRVTLIRVGRRVAFVETKAWQRDETKPVTLARYRFKITPKKVFAKTANA